MDTISDNQTMMRNQADDIQQMLREQALFWAREAESFGEQLAMAKCIVAERRESEAVDQFYKDSAKACEPESE